MRLSRLDLARPQPINKSWAEIQLKMRDIFEKDECEDMLLIIADKFKLLNLDPSS